MITLDRITLREIQLPLVEPFRAAHGTVSARRILLLELEDRDGTRAWSECVAESLPMYSSESVDTCWLTISDWIAPRVLGVAFASPRDADTVPAEEMRACPMARAAVEMGMWTIRAVQLGKPLAVVLARDAIPRTHVESGIALGMHSTPADLAVRVRSAAADGYRRIKLKIEPGHDVAYVRAAREALGDGDVALTVDANCSYSLDDPADVRALEELDGLGLGMIEQPLGRDDLLGHAELQRRLRTPICLDESIKATNANEFAIAMGSARIINLKPGRVGGFTNALIIHDRCTEAGIPVWCGGMLESGIGRAYNVALASLPNFTLPGDLSPSSRYWERDIVIPPWTMDAHGRVQVPLDRPGIGVEVDEGYIDQLTVRVLELRAGTGSGRTT